MIDETWTHIVAHTLYAALLMMALWCIWLTFIIGRAIDKTSVQLHPILYMLYVVIFALSVIQTTQAFQLLLKPLTPLWWIPFFCKGGSLATYIIFLKFIHWRHQLDNDLYSAHCDDEGKKL